MKKILLTVPIFLLATSCITTTKTARNEEAPYAMYNATVADLQVAPERITYTLKPSLAIRKGGLNNCKQAAINEALDANGNADLLVEPQFVITQKRGLFIKKVKSVTVTGRPATYKNFRSLPDSVWCNPALRENEDKSKKSNSFKEFFKF